MICGGLSFRENLVVEETRLMRYDLDSGNSHLLEACPNPVRVLVHYGSTFSGVSLAFGTVPHFFC